MGIGNLLGLFKDDPEFGTLSNIKSRPLADRINQLMGDWTANRSAGQSAFNDYLSKYSAGLGDATARTGQEMGAMDQFYNGGMSNTLAGLRAQREAAVNDAARVAMQQAQRNANLSRLSSPGGSSSYDQRLLAGMMTPISTQAALDSAEQRRNDLNYLTQMQLGLTGQRQGLANALAGYGLVPDQVRRGMYMSDVQGLSPLIQMDQANTFYGLQKKTTDLDRWQSFLSNEEADLMNMAGVGANAAGSYLGAASAARGGGGGGSL